jgi:glycosyltransferase involved in cell wall biosynthesis
MRILIITQIYLPEMGALSNRLYPIAKAMASAGHEVAVATGMPNYPAGKVFPEYRGKLFTREERDGYSVLRTAYYTAPRNRSKVSQLASYLSFVPSVLFGGLRGGKFDLVFVSSPPPFPIVAAIQLARLSRAKLAIDVRDLWSDELVSYGGMKESSTPIRLVRRIEKWGYRRADLVTCTTHSLIDTVVERGSKPDRTVLLPNGADTELFRPLPIDETQDKYNFGDRFVVMYSGLFGIKHGLETLLDAARLLRHKKELVFFLLGNGARRDALVQKIKDESIDNVIIGDECPVEEIPQITARAGVCFAATRAEAYVAKLISVKIFEYMACAKPVIGSVAGESARVIEESGGGLVVPPGDPGALANAVVQLYLDSQLCFDMGQAGRRYVEKSYSRSAWAAKLCDRLEEVVKADRTSRDVIYAKPAAVPPES